MPTRRWPPTRGTGWVRLGRRVERPALARLSGLRGQSRMKVERRSAALTAIATHLPAGELTNEDLARELGDWSAEKIFQKTGIRTRRIAADDECASDLGVEAAQRLLATGVCDPGQVDFLIFCTQSPDYFLPTTACTVQARLALRTSCGAVDI